MPTLVEMKTCQAGYVDLVCAVSANGVRRSPRDMPTLDLGHVIVSVQSPYNALPLGVGRQLSPAIAAAEALQLIAGKARHDLLPNISPEFLRYREPNGKFHGAYGDRIGDQVSWAVRRLEDDRDTRRAVITLWNPALDSVAGFKDYPCTVALDFTLVDDQLELRTLMRSNDVWLGFPYDVFQFTQLQLTVARALGVSPGRYTHEAWSLHLYTKHADLVDDLHEPTDEQFQPNGFGRAHGGVRPIDAWRTYRARAITALSGGAWKPNTPSERWYFARLRNYVTA